MPVIPLDDEPLEKYCKPETGAVNPSSGALAKKQAAEEKDIKILSAGFAHGSQTLILPPQPKKPP